MKISKKQLKEMIRKVVRERLNEYKEKGLPGSDKPMKPQEVEQHLEKEKEKSAKRKAQKKRAAAKQSARGMELESKDDEVESNEANAEEDEHLTKLEQKLLNMEII